MRMRGDGFSHAGLRWSRCTAGTTAPRSRACRNRRRTSSRDGEGGQTGSFFAHCGGFLKKSDIICQDSSGQTGRNWTEEDVVSSPC